MRIFRSILVALIAVSVMLLPVSAATAMAYAAHATPAAHVTRTGTHADHVEMDHAHATMSAPDGECASCKATASDLCTPACCSMQMLSVDTLVIARPIPERFAREHTVRVTTVGRPPDPPPPRG